MIVERTDFMSVPVTDLERSARFYEETLGLPKNPGAARGPSSRQATSARDPDGNALMLHRRYAPHES